MRIIAKGKEANIKFWMQSSPKDASYRLMRYCIREDCEEGVLLLNIVTGELVLIEQAETSLVDNLPAGYKPEMDELITHRFLVPEGFDDFKFVNQLRTILQRFGIRNSIRTFSILPTTACNARCFYCYEAGIPPHTMTQETVDKVVEFIDVNRGEERAVNLHWFGGEPTVGEKQIDQICERLIEKGIGYKSAMISNGYLFSKEMAQKAKEKWKLQRIQITLDGTEEVYNRTKAYVNAEGNPFLRVMDNIGFLLDEGIFVSVRMNLDFYNAVDLKALILDLTSRFAGRKNFSAYVHEIFENEGFCPVVHGNAEKRELVRLVESLNCTIEENGCKVARGALSRRNLPSLRIYYCMADNPSSVMINPLGQIGKCEHEVCSHLVGDIHQGIEYSPAQAQYWLNPTWRECCQECALYPLCGQISICGSKSDCLPEQAQINIHAVRQQIQSRFNQTKQIIKEDQDHEET